MNIQLFLKPLPALQVWQQRLQGRGSMSWLNPQGQQVIASKALDTELPERHVLNRK